MRVVIRFGKGSAVGAVRRPKNPAFALVLGTLLTLAAVAAGVLGLWRISADLGWTSNFAITAGFFSHWQVWMAAAVLLEVASRSLHRYARRAAVAGRRGGTSRQPSGPANVIVP